MEQPDLKEPVEPTHTMKTETKVVDGNNVVTETHVPVLNEKVYGSMYKQYRVQYKAWYTKTETWTEMRANIF